MIFLNRIYIKYIKFCVKYCKKKISQIPNFNGEHSDTPVCKTLKRDHPLSKYLNFVDFQRPPPPCMLSSNRMTS